MDILFHPIGVIHSPFTRREETPRHGEEETKTVAELELNPELTEGIADMRVGERYQVLFFFHQSSGYKLTVPMHGTGPMTGLFSTHSPNRPNAIGVTVITVTEIRGNRIFFTGVDMLDGTPVLDIKSYE